MTATISQIHDQADKRLAASLTEALELLKTEVQFLREALVGRHPELGPRQLALQVVGEEPDEPGEDGRVLAGKLG